MNTELIGAIKYRFKEVVNEIPDLDYNVKRVIFDALGSNWADSCFQIDDLEFQMREMYKRTLEEVINRVYLPKQQLWMDICKAAAQHSSQPHLIADEALAGFEAKMEILKNQIGTYVTS